VLLCVSKFIRRLFVTGGNLLINIAYLVPQHCKLLAHPAFCIAPKHPVCLPNVCILARRSSAVRALHNRCIHRTLHNRWTCTACCMFPMWASWTDA